MEEKKKQTEPEACKVAKKCGGCQYQGVPYKEQLKKKQKMVNALLSKYGKVEPIIGTLSLIMERYHAGEIPIEELQMMPPKEVELLFYPQKNIKKKDIPLPDFQYYYDRIHAN